MILALLAGIALADDGAGAAVDVGGDLKGFVIAGFPYDSLLLPENPNLRLIGDGRLKFSASVGTNWKMDFHHAVTVATPNAPTQLEDRFDLDSDGGASMGFGTGVGVNSPEAVQLTWTAFSDSDWMFRGRTDRLWISWEEGPARVTLGRQAISFGTGRFFTPLDLVNPFSPATIDSQYKPGVDALRLEMFSGVSNQLTVAAAYGNDWDFDGLVLAINGNTTMGLSDLGLFLGGVYGDFVIGGSVESSVGPVGVHGDVSVTLPRDEDPFVRAVTGIDLVPSASTFVSFEAYIQTFGAEDASDYLSLSSNPRLIRGEVWQLGRYYFAASVRQEITPLLSANLATIVNLGDPSLLFMPGIGYSVSERSDFVAGAFAGIGKHPTSTTISDLMLLGLSDSPFGIQSEYGMVPVTAYAQWKSYF